MNAIEIYKKNFDPPAWAIKEIGGGRIKGMSDINPQWRIQALTETFGLCGMGWKYEIEKTWLESAGAETSAFAKVNLYIKGDDTGKWSDPIPAIGGSSFLAIEAKGAYQSDECFKMAITDAISVCCKMLGIGGKIYLGSKYDKYEKQLETEKELDKSKKEAKDKINDEAIELQLAIDEMRRCTNLEQVKAVWNANKKMQFKAEFMQAKEELKVKLTPKTA